MLADPSEKLISLGDKSSISIDLQSASLEVGLKSWTLGQAGLEMLESEVEVNTHTASDQGWQVLVVLVKEDTSLVGTLTDRMA